jgi:hypothetical protein
VGVNHFGNIAEQFVHTKSLDPSFPDD